MSESKEFQFAALLEFGKACRAEEENSERMIVSMSPTSYSQTGVFGMGRTGRRGILPKVRGWLLGGRAFPILPDGGGHRDPVQTKRFAFGR
jgi:hypothetical protein